MLRRIPRDEARSGMYVHAFDGPWLSHPYWRPRFLLSSDEQVERLKSSGIPSFVIDEELGVSWSPPSSMPLADETGPRRVKRRDIPAPEKPSSYAVEYERAIEIAAKSKSVVRHVLEGVRQGRTVEVADMDETVEDIVGSVSRNPHALIGLTRLRSKDEYTFVHSLAVGTLMVNLACHLGLDQDIVREIGTAGLLHDVGKMAVPDRILNKPGPLSPDEMSLIRTHPEQGYRLMTEGSDTPDIVLDVARHHHERIDGTGYPLRLKGSEISLYARIAAICDVYDALTSQRAYKEAWSPGEALARMHSWEGHFDPALLFSFMQSIGVFPLGMLVRLRSERLAVVVASGRGVKPSKVCAFFSTADSAMLKPELLVLGAGASDDQAMAEEYPQNWGFEDWDDLKKQLFATCGLRQVA